MPQKPLDLAMEVAKAFVKDMRAFHAETNEIKKDEIVVRQAWLLNKHMPPRQRKLRISDVRDMFERMKDLV